jgi:hypothetical protein
MAANQTTPKPFFSMNYILRGEHGLVVGWLLQPADKLKQLEACNDRFTNS